MPVDESKSEQSKKSIQKIRRRTAKSRSKSRQGNLNRKQSTKENELNQLTSANISSLRWEFILDDPILEANRIEEYKELRRQRYINAQQQTIEKLNEKKKISYKNK